MAMATMRDNFIRFFERTGARRILLAHSGDSATYNNSNSNSNIIDLQQQHLDEVESDLLFAIPSATSFRASLAALEKSDPVACNSINLDKLRYEFISDNTIRVRMPESPFHSSAAHEVSVLIEHELLNFAKTKPDTSDEVALIRDLYMAGTADVKFASGGTIRPDAQFRLALQKVPGVIIEIANTQSMKDLTNKLYFAIDKSDGAINMAIGINIFKQPSTLSALVANVKGNTTYYSIPYERAALTLDSSKALEVPLKAFAPLKIIQTHFPCIDPEAKISIRLADIAARIEKLRIKAGALGKGKETSQLKKDFTKTQPKMPSETHMRLLNTLRQYQKIRSYSTGITTHPPYLGQSLYRAPSRTYPLLLVAKSMPRWASRLRH